jgi:hypothetical protein
VFLEALGQTGEDVLRDRVRRVLEDPDLPSRLKHFSRRLVAMDGTGAIAGRLSEEVA